MAINNWTEYHNELKKKIFNAVENGTWRTLSVVNQDGSSQSYQSLEELFKYLDQVEAKAQAEEQASVISPYGPVVLRRRSGYR